VELDHIAPVMTATHWPPWHSQCPCPQSIVFGAQTAVQISPRHEGADSFGVHVAGWQQVAATQSSSSEQSPAPLPVLALALALAEEAGLDDVPVAEEALPPTASPPLPPAEAEDAVGVAPAPPVPFPPVPALPPVARVPPVPLPAEPSLVAQASPSKAM
jgi:hypothetical protein